MQNVWNDYVTTADGVYVSATEADAYITELEAIVDKLPISADGVRLAAVLESTNTRIAELMELLKSARAAMNGLDHNTDDIQLMNEIDAAIAETQDAN